MSLQIMTNINVDFYDNKYIMINAKQYDSGSRWVAVTCYNQGEILNISSSKHSAYIRYKKADEYEVLNSCRINYKGEILVELTEQMLSVDGICYVDLIIVNKGSAIVNVDTGEIITVDNSSILSTMAFCVNVYETPVDNSFVESSYEYDALNDALQKAEAEYTEVIRLSKSYAVGDAMGIRDGEDTDNAKYYYEKSLENANNAKASETNAKESEDNARVSADNSAASELNSLTYMNSSYEYMNFTEEYKDSAKESEIKASTSEENAKASETNAAASEENAVASATSAAASATSAAANAKIIGDSADLVKSYAVGGTGTRDGEDTDNASWYYNEIKDLFVGLNIVFVPKGTISFSELATVKDTAISGYVYNIKDDFVTDETFREGAGKVYTAGTNVYYTVDNYWDCFGGSASPVATVEEVKSYLGI